MYARHASSRRRMSPMAAERRLILLGRRSDNEQFWIGVHWGDSLSKGTGGVLGQKRFSHKNRAKMNLPLKFQAFRPIIKRISRY